MTRLTTTIFCFLFYIASLCNAAGYITPNFVVSAASQGVAREVGDSAEQWRDDMSMYWLGKKLPQWSRPCPINVHVGNSLGAGGNTSFVFDNGNVGNWRMSIQGSYARVLDSVLPHEITHTIFASYFRQPLPRWIDEGLCTTVEHRSEVVKQERMLIDFLKTGRGIAFDQMFAMKDYPQDVMPLYSQGHSVSQWLLDQFGTSSVINFIDDGLQDENWPRAVKTNFGYGDLFQMQEYWLEWVRAGRPDLTGRKVVTAGYQPDEDDIGPVFIWFHQNNCGPCVLMEPDVNQLMQMDSAVKKVNISLQPSYISKYNIPSTPTFIAVQDGRELDRITGPASFNTLQMFIHRVEKNWTQQVSGPSSKSAVPPPYVCRVSDQHSSLGTGVLVGSDGTSDYLLSVWHVFRDSGSNTFTATFPNGQTVSGQVLGKDTSNDLVLLKSPTTGIKPADLDIDVTPPDGTLKIGGYGDGHYAETFGKPVGLMNPTSPDNPDTCLLVSGASTRGGDSGSPVYNSANKVVGLHWGNTGGQAYVVWGQPVRRILRTWCPNVFPLFREAPAQRTRPRQAQQQPPIRQTVPASTSSFDQAAVDSRFTDLESRIDGKQDRGDYVLRGEITEYVRQGDLSVYAKQEELKSYAQQNDVKEALDVQRTGIYGRIEAKVKQVHEDVIAKIPAAGSTAVSWTLKNLLLAGGLSTGLAGVASYFGGWLVKRGLEKKLGNRGSGGPRDGGFQSANI